MLFLDEAMIFRPDSIGMLLLVLERNMQQIKHATDKKKMQQIKHTIQSELVDTEYLPTGKK